MIGGYTTNVCSDVTVTSNGRYIAAYISEDCRACVSQILANVLGLGSENEMQKQIVAIHRIGRYQPDSKRPVVFRVRSFDFKVQVLRSKSALGESNEHKHMSLVEQLPEIFQEAKRTQSFFFEQNKKAPAGHRYDMKFRGGQLLKEGEPFQQQFKLPTLVQVTDRTVADQNRVSELKIRKEHTESVQGSQFWVRVERVNTEAEVIDHYERTLLDHPSSTHISVAFLLPGVSIDRMGFADDGEHGAGRNLMSALLEKNHTGIAIICRRRYGGSHIGSKRFTIPKKLAEKQLKQLAPDAYR